MIKTLDTRFGAYTNELWTVLSNVWNPNAPFNQTYGQLLTFDTARPTEDTLIEWKFPAANYYALQIQAYPSILYGPGPWGLANPNYELTSGTVKALSSLNLKYDLEAGGDLTGYNVSFDIWLTDTPDGDASHITHEIMIWLHTGAFQPSGSVAGYYSDDLFSGKIYYSASNHYIAFASDVDDLSGEIDFLAMLQKVKSLGLISGDEYISGIQLGAEVAFGQGSLSINRFDVDINGSGDHIVFDDFIYDGSIRDDDIFIFGEEDAQGGGAGTPLRAATFDTEISFTLNAPIINGQTSRFKLVANGVDYGTFTIAPTAGSYVDQYGVTWSKEQNYTIKVPALVALSQLKMVFDGPVNVGGPENMSNFVVRASVNGVPLASAEYHPLNGSVHQQNLGSSVAQWNGGYTLFDVSPWNTYLAGLDIGSADRPIEVSGGGGTDTVHVLGRPDQYTVSKVSDSEYAIHEQSGLGQNAVLRDIAQVRFANGEIRDLAAWFQASQPVKQVASPPPAAVAPAEPHDFNGDGKADILWRNTSGVVTLWNSGPAGAFAGEKLGAPDKGWKIQQAADFNGDGTADILWRHDNGAATVWNSGPGGGFTPKNLGSVGPAWTFQEAADVNGDGRADILWRNASGAALLWKSVPGDDFVVQSLGTVGAEWKFQDAADFNGDDRSDFVWRNDKGGVCVWLANADGSGFTSQSLGTVGLDWKLQAAADVTGDGKADLIWRNDSGRVLLWMSGPGASYTPQDVGRVAPEWKFQQAADFSGDGKADLLWRNDSGSTALWTTGPSGASFSSQALGVVAADWSIWGA